MGKGSTPRPLSISPEELARRWPFPARPATPEPSDDTFAPQTVTQEPRTATIGEAPTLGDPADAASTSRRVGAWTVEQWEHYFRRNPDATAPSGVAGALVRYIDELRTKLPIV